MSRSTYPFGPINPPRPVPLPDPGNSGTRPPRIPEPRPVQPAPDPGNAGRPPRVDPPPGPTGPGLRPPRVDPPVGPVGPGVGVRPPRTDPPIGPRPVAVDPNAMPGDYFRPVPFQPAADDVRGQALAKLLGRAELYGDRGDSTQTLTDLLNGVDMGGAGRAAADWSTRQRVLTDTGERYRSQYADALKALRAKQGSGGGRSGGGGGGGGLMPAGGLTDADYQWLDEYMQTLNGPKPAPGYKPPTRPGRTFGPAGYAASQHPIAYKAPKKSSTTKAIAT